MNFSGTYYVVSSPDFDVEYLKLGGELCITLRQDGESVRGKYEIDDQCGTINGGTHGDVIAFAFCGNDEMEEVSATVRLRWRGSS